MHTLFQNVSRIMNNIFGQHTLTQKGGKSKEKKEMDRAGRRGTCLTDLQVRRSFKTSCSVCHINSLTRSSISGSLGGGLTASTTRQSVGKSKRWESENLDLLLLLTFCVWMPYFCFPSLRLYLSISLYYVSSWLRSLISKPLPCSLSPSPSPSALRETFPLRLAILTSVCESYRSHLFSAAVLLTCYWSLARPPLCPLGCSYNKGLWN